MFITWSFPCTAQPLLLCGVFLSPGWMPEDTGRVHRVMGWGLGSSAWAEGIGAAATAHPPNLASRKLHNRDVMLFLVRLGGISSLKKKNPKHKMYLSARKINIFAESSQPSCQLQFA